MRIIDKNRDYYDYLQSSEDNRIVFDRRGSFILTKEDVCTAFRSMRRWDKTPYRFLLLQCGCTYWLLLAEITSYEDGFPSDYKLELFSSWKNYSKDRKLLDISVICPKFPFAMWKTPLKEDILKYKDAFQSEVSQGNFSKEGNLGKSYKCTDYKGGWKKEVMSFPLLKECGIAGIVDAQELFCAIEEYFSMQITDSERTEPFGMTNNDKIESHGFDVTTSFRGKK